MQKIQYAIDYFENTLATLEHENKQLIIPKDWLPDTAKEGDLLKLELTKENGSSTLTFHIDKNATQARLGHLKAQRAKLAKAPEGDIDL